MTISIHIQLFARFCDLLGCECLDIQLDEPHTVEHLQQQLQQQYPQLTCLLSTTRFAVNGEYAELQQPIRSTDELALIPPVSGG